MELGTPRLLLREFRATDHPAVHAYAGDAEVVRYMDWGPNDLDATARFLSEVGRDATAAARTSYGLAVVNRADGALIGCVAVHISSAVHRRGELGYVLARASWGQGFATEAASAVLRFGFDELGLHKVSATCDPDNAGSARVLSKIGMRAEGHLRDHLLIRGQWRDRLLFAALATAG
jgi:RimJ/RimL family protein N-acetyltransferase